MERADNEMGRLRTVIPGELQVPVAGDVFEGTDDVVLLLDVDAAVLAEWCENIGHPHSRYTVGECFCGMVRYDD